MTPPPLPRRFSWPEFSSWRFQVSVACALGYLTFWTTGANHSVETGLFFFGLTLTVLQPQFQITSGLSQFGCLLVFFNGMYESLRGVPSVVALAHFAAGTMIMQTLCMPDPRRGTHALLLSSMLVLTAGAMNVNFFFPLGFFPYVAIFCLTLQSLSRAMQKQPASSIFGQATFFPRTLLLQGVLFSIIWLGFFYLFPRGDAISLGRAMSNQRLKGFSQTLRLGEVGSVLENTMVVMRIRPVADFNISGPFIRRLKGLLLRGRSFSRYNLGTWTREDYRSSLLWVGRQQGSIPIEKGLVWGNIRMSLEIMQENTDPPVLFVPVNAYVLNTRRSYIQVDTDGSFAFDRRSPGTENYQALIEVGSPDLTDYPYPPLNEVSLSLAPFLDLEPISPSIQDLAEEIASGAPTTLARIERTISYLKNNYQYSLEEPETQVRDPIAQFLLDTREGSCEHFASAMTLLLRSMGIPARPVSGYVMNDWNEYGGFFTVRQSDAHAWVEVFWPGLGWVPFDPTPPQREDVILSFLDRIARVRDIWNQFEGHWFNLVYRFDRRAQETGFRKIWSRLQSAESLMLWALLLFLLGFGVSRRLARRSSRRESAIGYPWIPLWFKAWEQTLPSGRQAWETPREFLNRLFSAPSPSESVMQDLTVVLDSVTSSVQAGNQKISCPCMEQLNRLREFLLQKKAGKS